MGSQVTLLGVVTAAMAASKWASASGYLQPAQWAKHRSECCKKRFEHAPSCCWTMVRHTWCAQGRHRQPAGHSLLVVEGHHPALVCAPEGRWGRWLPHRPGTARAKGYNMRGRCKEQPGASLQTEDPASTTRPTWQEQQHSHGGPFNEACLPASRGLLLEGV